MCVHCFFFLGTFLCCHHINSVVRNCLVIVLLCYLFNTCALSVQMVQPYTSHANTTDGLSTCPATYPLHTECCGYCEGGLPNSVTVLLHHHNPYLAQSSFTKQSHNRNSFFPPHKSICFMPKQPNPCLALTAHKQTRNRLKLSKAP